MHCSRFIFFSMLLGMALLGAAAKVCLAQPTPLGTRFTVLPGVSTPVYLNVLPNAVCRLRQVDTEEDHDDWELEDKTTLTGDINLPVGTSAATIQKFLRLYSDANGYVRFNSEPPEGVSGVEMKLSMRCAANGERQKYKVILRASDAATADMPFPPTSDPAFDQSNATILPALTGDPQAFTNAELMRLGYPPRPDSSANPNAYALWLATVTQPITVLQPQTVAGRGIRFTTTASYSGNWSGYELVPDTNSYGYDLVEGHWIVPGTRGEVFRNAHASQWVGMDGDGINYYYPVTDLVQAGTAQDVLPAALVGPPMLGKTWNLSIDYAWTEVLPLQPVEQVIPNFPIHPGDGILCTVWVGWEQSAPDPVGGNVFFKLVNSSVAGNNGQPAMVTLSTKIVDESGFNYLINFYGKTAEWIVERPTQVQNAQPVGLLDLANYQSQCYGKNLPNFGNLYIDATSAWSYVSMTQQDAVEFSGRDNYAFTMLNNGTYLSIPSALDSHSICFNWLAFH